MSISRARLEQIIREEVTDLLGERCQKGYKTHAKRKTKKMFGRTYRNCVKAEGIDEEDLDEVASSERQRRWACAQMGDNFKGERSLSKKEAEKMCKDPVKPTKKGKK